MIIMPIMQTKNINRVKREKERLRRREKERERERSAFSEAALQVVCSCRCGMQKHRELRVKIRSARLCGGHCVSERPAGQTAPLYPWTLNAAELPRPDSWGGGFA